MNFAATQIDSLLDRMAEQLREHFQQHRRDRLAIVGIHSGGAWIAAELQQRLNPDWPLGSLDISFYRDDFGKRGLNPSVKRTELPFSVDEQHLLLVDDVLMSGRTVRAAMNELFDFGRPASVSLAVLFDVGRRELPIRADVCGETLALEPHQRVQLHGPAPLRAEITDTGTQ